MRRVLIVIPSFNEARALPGLLAELHRVATTLPQQIELLVIDDCSSDATREVALANGARCIRLSSNLGIGGAVQTGLRVALSEGFDAAVLVDGDGQHLPAALGPLLAALEGTNAPDLVIGSRFLRATGWQSSSARRLGKRWLSFVLNTFCGVRVTDPTSGFRAFGPRALQLFARSFPYDFPEPESLSMARMAGLRHTEVAVEMRARATGQSSIGGLVPLYYMTKVTLAVLLSRVRNARSLRA